MGGNETGACILCNTVGKMLLILHFIHTSGEFMSVVRLFWLKRIQKYYFLSRKKNMI